MDEDGYFWFQARTDDMIISSGYNISGFEVEAALLEHPLVTECAVVAAPDEERGHVVKAFVVASAAVSARALQDHVKASIAPYKYPRRIEFVEELPRTPTGKVQRNVLRERCVRRLQPPGWPEPRGYSNGIAASGELIFIGGQIGWDETGAFPFVDLPGQVGQALRNIVTVLAEAGAGPEHVVRLTWYVTSREDYLASLKEIGAAYRAVMGRHFPTMAVVEVDGARRVLGARRDRGHGRVVVPAHICCSCVANRCRSVHPKASESMGWPVKFITNEELLREPPTRSSRASRPVSTESSSWQSCSGPAWITTRSRGG